MLLILDASIIAKWFKEEADSAKALELRAGFHDGLHEIMVPDLLLYEISNALRYDKNFNSDIIAKSIDSLFEMDLIITMPSADLISKATEVALEFGITVYDAIYVALASQTNGVFITADKALYEKIKELENCKLLAEI